MFIELFAGANERLFQFFSHASLVASNIFSEILLWFREFNSRETSPLESWKPKHHLIPLVAISLCKQSYWDVSAGFLCHIGYFGCEMCSCLFEKHLLIVTFPTMYPPQAVRQVILAVYSLVAWGDVAKVAGLLHAVWWGEGLEGEQAVVAVHLRWYIWQKQTTYRRENLESRS